MTKITNAEEEMEDTPELPTDEEEMEEAIELPFEEVEDSTNLSL